MMLSELVRGLAGPEGPIPAVGPAGGDPDILGLCYRAQAVAPGSLFVAVPGFSADGHDFAGEAVQRGAAALMVQRPVGLSIPTVAVPDTRAALGPLAARFYGDPSRSLALVGVTGTNGKTTVTLLLESILNAAGYQPGVIGTIDCHFAGRKLPSPATTPEAPDLQRMLSEMRAAGITHAVMEVSSHAVDLRRIDGCAFDVGVFTNLTQDHLDYHGTMDAYWACKRRFFTSHLARGAKQTAAAMVINGDDARGRSLADENIPIRRFVVGQSPDDMIRTDVFCADLTGAAGELALGDARIPFRTRLIGAHNLENIRCAAGAGLALGLAPEVIRDGVAALTAVPGRLEPVRDSAGRFVFVDYAHTPDALEHALSALRPLTRGRLICVFGCGGDRDRTKRPLMGEAAGRGADLAVITSDNPRTEDPDAIVEDIRPGMERAGVPFVSADALADSDPDEAGQEAPGGNRRRAVGFGVEPDRRRAIFLAVAAARPGDAVLIAGKGHETYQIVGRERRSFDDREVARSVLAAAVPPEDK
ncbi:MAG: UDP-N-acetylmuramoyl-L-alanyl-D-glutamate--2,6-diaminopimelate ligase [Desulfococcaceae bacterium]